MLPRWTWESLTLESNAGSAEELAVRTSCGEGSLRGHGGRDLLEWGDM